MGHGGFGYKFLGPLHGPGAEGSEGSKGSGVVVAALPQVL
jgi:hypothetical protein